MSSKDNNKGFSMIEIIVVFALMALVTGGGVSIYSWVKNHRIESFAKNVDNAISSTRSLTLTKSGSYELLIKFETDKFVAEILHDGTTLEKRTLADKKTLGSISSGSIWCYDASGAQYKVESGNVIHISFNKTDGGFKETKVGSGVGAVDITDEIHVKYSNNKEKTIRLIKVTGKHYLE